MMDGTMTARNSYYMVLSRLESSTMKLLTGLTGHACVHVIHVDLYM
jgi:hypothetical protein